jgi:hypothetical protein
MRKEELLTRDPREVERRSITEEKQERSHSSQRDRFLFAIQFPDIVLLTCI